MWLKGSPATLHFLASNDWVSVEWRDPSSKAMKGALDLAAVVAVLPRTGKGHKKSMFTRADADPDCCIVMEAGDEKR